MDNDKMWNLLHDCQRQITVGLIRSHMNIGTYMFLTAWFEAAVAFAVLGSRICTEIFAFHLAPSIVQRSPWYFAHTYLGGPGVQYEIWAQMLKGLKSHFYTFLEIYIGYSNETW